MIYIDNRQDKIKVEEELLSTIEKVINHALKEEHVTIENEVSVIFVDNNFIRMINKEERGIDRVTDVLSFPLLDYPMGMVYKEAYKDEKFGPEDLEGGILPLGDIVLSLEKAKEQSEEFGHSYLREACYLTIHSVLHLLGYDHMEDDEKIIMREREEAILSNFNIVR